MPNNPTRYCSDCKHYNDGRCYAHPPTKHRVVGAPAEHVRADPNDDACGEFVPAPVAP